MKKTIALILAMVMAMSALTACGGSSDSTSSAGQTDASGAAVSEEGEHVFKVALDGDIIALDPAFAYDFTTNPVINQITQGLMTFDENDQVVPQLVSSWEAVDDTTYVYEVRDDVTFSDGSAMTMEDVLFSLERTMDPATGSYVQWMFSSVDSFEQTGDWELTVHLKEPYSQWKYVFATTAGHIISKAYYEEHAADFGTAEGGIMGTGPYVYESWTSGQEIVLTKNQNYWDKEQTLEIDRIEFKIIPEDTTRVAALQTREVDFTVATPSDMLDTLNADDSLEVQTTSTRGLTYIAFNTQRAPFDDANVRKAILHAINLDDIQENVIKEAGTQGTCLPHSSVLYTINPEEWESYVENHADAYGYDLDKAKEYLAQSAYPDGFDCSLITSESSLRYSIALAVQENLKELGINVEIIKVNGDEHTAYQSGEILDANGDRDYDMILAGWEADYPDISGNIEPCYASYNAGEGGFNAAVYMNDEVDALLSVQATSLDDNERNQAMFDLMDIVNEDIPYVYVYYPNKQATINKKFTGFTMNASWNWNMFLKDIRYAE